MKNFNAEMIENAKTAKSAEELIELAKAGGVKMTADEAAIYFAQLNPESGELSDDELDAVAGGGCGNSEELKNRPTLHARVRILTGQSCPNCRSKEGKYKPPFFLAGEHILCDCDTHYSIDNCEIGIGVELI